MWLHNSTDKQSYVFFQWDQKQEKSEAASKEAPRFDLVSDPWLKSINCYTVK